GGQGAHAHAVLRGDDDVDRVEICAALVLEGGGRPGVVLTHGELQPGVDLLLRDDEGAGGDDLGRVAGPELLAGASQGGGGEQRGVDRGDGLREARRGRREVELHGRRIDDLAVVVVVDRLGDGQRTVGIALAEEVEVLHHVL